MSLLESADKLKFGMILSLAVREGRLRKQGSRKMEPLATFFGKRSRGEASELLSGRTK